MLNTDYYMNGRTHTDAHARISQLLAVGKGEMMELIILKLILITAIKLHAWKVSNGRWK